MTLALDFHHPGYKRRCRTGSTSPPPLGNEIGPGGSKSVGWCIEDVVGVCTESGRQGITGGRGWGATRLPKMS